VTYPNPKIILADRKVGKCIDAPRMHALNDEELVRESFLVAGDHIVGIHLCLNVRFWTESFRILRREGCFGDDYSIRETASIPSEELVLR